MRSAVFVDRDGTLIEESGYLDTLDRVALFPFSIDAVRLLNRAGLAVVIVSNQSGIARGLLTEAFVRETHEHLVDRFAAGGAAFDGFYYCPHHPRGTVDGFNVVCDCRKPAPGLLTRAARDLDLDLTRSVVIGDRWGDVGCAAAVGAAGVLVRTGYGRQAEAQPPEGVTAAAIVDDLAGAVAWTLRVRRGRTGR